MAAPPEAFTDRFCAPGRDPRSAILKVSGPPVTDRVGSEDTFKVTATVTGLLVAPDEVRVIDPVYCPTCSPEMTPALSAAVTPVGVVALPGETVSHEPPFAVVAAAL